MVEQGNDGAKLKIYKLMLTKVKIVLSEMFMEECRGTNLPRLLQQDLIVYPTADLDTRKKIELYQSEKVQHYRLFPKHMILKKIVLGKLQGISEMRCHLNLHNILQNKSNCLMDSGLSELISTIKLIKQAGAFPQYIDYIQFPFFRNIELDQRINFNFPLTVFVGPNGSGKSSTLHALYGCPEGKTPYEFWFSTEVDPVEYVLESRKLRHSFFYGFKDEDGEDLQVVKARIRRGNNPNYWETSRPLLSYGMEKPPGGKERNEPIKKNVVYLDFRAELSAFDKYFYFETPPAHLVSNTKQDYLRFKSSMLRNLFNELYEVAFDPWGHPLNQPIIKLGENELKAISTILGKEYIEGKFLKHKLFRSWGYSILLKTRFHKYSEAFAGSGELAVIRLVQEILKAPPGSLILLDEPEVSLHPAAQKNLRNFLLEQIKRTKHQIIISTHSPSLIEGLPRESIKVFHQKFDTGKFIIKENILPEEAFFFIGQDIDDKINIIVEDTLSKKMIDRLLFKLGEEVSNRFEVKFISGGSSVLQQYISVYSNTNIEKAFFVFDGDQKRVDEHFDVNSLSDANKNVDNLKSVIRNQTGREIRFYPDGGDEGANQIQLIDMMIAYLRYYKMHVFYLPLSTPENIIWSEDVIQQKLNPTNLQENIERLRALGNNKERIFEASKLLFGAENKKALEDLLITDWLQKEDENYMSIKNMILHIEETV